MIPDVVVVGAGSAGCALAARLSEDPQRSVLLIEAGPDYTDLESLPDELKYGLASAAVNRVSGKHDWMYVARANIERGWDLPVPRGKVVGGTSAINGQVFLRGAREDYDGWRGAGNPGWSFEDLLPIFRQIESDSAEGDDIHGRSGPIAVRRYPPSEWLPAHAAFQAACVELGFPVCADANSPDTTGVGPYPLNNVGGLRLSSALAYLPAARKRANFRLSADTLVRRVVFDGQRVIGVEVQRASGRSVITARHVILCAGAIGSPHILLRSGVGDPAHLRAVGVPVVHSRMGVGANLQDHAVVGVRWRLAENYRAKPNQPFAQIINRYSSVGSADPNDMWLSTYVNGGSCTIYAGISLPAARGSLYLESDDPESSPKLDYALLGHEQDLFRMRDAIRLCVALAATEALAPALKQRMNLPPEILSDDAQLNRWMVAHVETSHHVCGTCKLGPSGQDDSVVGTGGSVHGIVGLRVADASIMPRIVRANTNLTSIVIGEKIAAMIRNDPAGARSHGLVPA